MTRHPDIYVIGAYKCGTTMLQRFLEEHPDIYVPTVKEPNHWAFAGLDDEALALLPSAAWSVRDRSAYDALFADVADEPVVAEVSPEYLKSDQARRNLAAHAPDARFVAIIRDPVDRAYSDFMMYRRDGVEPLDDFAAAIAAQAERRAAGLAIGDYLATGDYEPQLRAWFDAVGRDRVLVVLYDDLRADPGSVAADIYRFAGVDDTFRPAETDAVNVSGVPQGLVGRIGYAVRNTAAPLGKRLLPQSVRRRIDGVLQRQLVKEPLDPTVRAALVRELRPDIEALADLLDRPLDAWLTAET